MNQWINKNKNTLIAAAILLYIIAVLVNLGYPELEGEEPRRALVTIEMIESGNYIVPTMFGWDYYNKPPMYNWVMAGVMHLTGSTAEWVVRLPSLLFILIWAAINFLVVRRYSNTQIAALSSVFLATGGEIFFYGLENGGEIDIFYGFIVYMQVVCIFHFHQQQKWLMLFLSSYFFCAVGFLTKGFPSIVFQGLTLTAWVVYAKRWKLLFHWAHLAGILIFSLIAGGYLLLYDTYSSAPRLLVNLLNESLRKTALGEAGGKIWDKTLGFPLEQIKGLLPWSLLMLLLFSKKIRYVWNNPLVRFSILFIVFNIWVYWFTGKLKLRYTYMFLPFFSLLLAHIFDAFQNGFSKKLDQYIGYSRFLFFTFAAALVVVAFVAGLNLFGAIICALLSSLIGFLFFEIKTNRVWLLAFGLIVLRLSYSWVLLPERADTIRGYKYRPVVNELTTHYQGPLIYFARPDTISIVADARFFKWELEKIFQPPFIYSQLPYYYYRKTGDLIIYDSTAEHADHFITYRMFLPSVPVDTVWKTEDRRWGDQLMLLRNME